MTVTEIPTPVRGGQPIALTVAQDGGVWYSAGRDIEGSAVGTPHVGRINPRTRRVDVIPIPAQSAALDLAAAADGSIWATVAEGDAWRLIRIDSRSKTASNVPPHIGAGVFKLAVGPSGRLFGQLAGRREGPLGSGISGTPSEIVELDPGMGGRRTVYRTPCARSDPRFDGDTCAALNLDLAVEPGGAVWAAESFRNDPALGHPHWAVRVDPDSGAFARYPLPVVDPARQPTSVISMAAG